MSLKTGTLFDSESSLFSPSDELENSVFNEISLLFIILCFASPCETLEAMKRGV